ncbi:BQ2448_4601 [Microbotryum intermedium]|uniref:BQ2448_4601 protein n=1 Tax=Microbotryum intermedium TaxID=269621 RepID=A0A238FFA0_9BASI|nr:BQ2448_4601 [Microbotryum intermedium]
MGIGANRSNSKSPSVRPQALPTSGSSSAPFTNSANPAGGATRGQQQNDRLYLCLPFVKAALVKGNFKTIVALPKYVDVNEWVAVNLVDLFNNLNLFYSVVTEFCTIENNPTMSAGPGMDYTWIDANRKRVKLPAPQYIDYVLTWVEGLIKDESVFPTKAGQYNLYFFLHAVSRSGNLVLTLLSVAPKFRSIDSGREFSPNFPSVARHIYTQLLRIFAHLYHAHYPIFLHLSSEGHLNSLFAHFLTFGREFDLLEEKETRAPKEGWPFVIGDLMDAWKGLGILEP